ncbi:MAG: PepSY domain-containing protein [Hyphomicrobiaceae bacterium]
MHFIKAAVVAASVALVPGAVAAQTSTPSTSTQSGTQQSLVAGANSFTEAQAQDRIEKAGFTEVKALKKDDQGIWRGTAMQSGKQVNVALDFQGNIVANP